MYVYRSALSVLQYYTCTAYHHRHQGLETKATDGDRRRQTWRRTELLGTGGNNRILPLRIRWCEWWAARNNAALSGKTFANKKQPGVKQECQGAYGR